jgi:hypothetical protein
MTAMKPPASAAAVKGSVKEALGKLIGDGSVEAEGRSEAQGSPEGRGSPEGQGEPEARRPGADGPRRADKPATRPAGR